MKYSYLIMVITTIMILSCGQNSTKNSEKEVNRDTQVSTTVGPSADLPPATIDVPEPTRKAFMERHPNAVNVNWARFEPFIDIDWTLAGWPTLDSSDFTVRYTDNGVEYYDWYDENNNWIGTVSPVNDLTGLPKAVQDLINKDYNGYTMVSAKRENDKNRVAYEIKMEKGNDKIKLLVDENGKLIKKVTLSDGEKTKEKTM